MRIIPVNTYSVLSSRHNKEQSFAGRTENPIKKDANGKSYVEILDTNVSNLSDGTAHSLDNYIEVYKSKVYDPYHKFVKTENTDNNLIYVADPKESVGSDIYKSHAYIIYDDEPKMPTLDELEQKFKSRKVFTKDYFDDANLSQQYNSRLNIVAQQNIKKSENFLEKYKEETKNYDSYQTCRPADIIALYKKALTEQQNIEENRKISRKSIDGQLLAHEVKVALKLSENDFIQRDKLAMTIESIDNNIREVDKRLKDIEVEKYLLDERTEQMQKDLEAVKRREDEERERCGPSYNSTYPPSQTYYHRTYLENQRRNNIEKSAKLQLQYDQCANLKNTYIWQKKEIDDKLNFVLEKLSRKFEEVKNIFKEYGDK